MLIWFVFRLIRRAFSNGPSWWLLCAYDALCAVPIKAATSRCLAINFINLWGIVCVCVCASVCVCTWSRGVWHYFMILNWITQQQNIAAIRIESDWSRHNACEHQGSYMMRTHRTITQYSEQMWVCWLCDGGRSTRSQSVTRTVRNAHTHILRVARLGYSFNWCLKKIWQKIANDSGVK